MSIAKLDRTVLRISGDDVAAWLDGLVTNNLKNDLTFAAILTPQGKIIADFFVWQNPERAQDKNGAIYIDTAAKFGAGLFKRLKMYRLRAPITIDDVSEAVSIYAVWNDVAGIEDPRLAGLRRLKSETSIDDTATPEEWDKHRLSLGLPDSQWDFETAETFPHNVNMDRLNGVDFKKGCFVGQEVVSRMQRKTDIRKRLCGIIYMGELDGTQIKAGERVIGDIVYSKNGQGMAMMRLDRLEASEAPPMVGAVLLSILKPDWT
jgi:folate-binding protein YgfZ